jgi:hypothetical protein
MQQPQVLAPVKWADCGWCFAGKRFEQRLRKFVDCEHCLGRGAVATNYICACGCPTKMVSNDSIVYCGRKECLADLRDDIRMDEQDRRWFQRDYAG